MIYTLNEGIVIEESEDNIIIFNENSSELVEFNSTGAYIVKSILKTGSLDTTINNMLRDFNNKSLPSNFEEIVSVFLEQLVGRGIVSYKE